MKLKELFELVNENETIHVTDGESRTYYDGRNSINEEWNEMDVQRIEVRNGVLRIEVESTESKLYRYFESAEEDDWMIKIWNKCCDKYLGNGDKIYFMEDFDELFYGESPSYIASLVCDGNYNGNDSFFIATRTSIETGGMYDFIDFDTLIETMIVNKDSLGNGNIQKILDGKEWDAE